MPHNTSLLNPCAPPFTPTAAGLVSPPPAVRSPSRSSAGRPISTHEAQPTPACSTPAVIVPHASQVYAKYAGLLGSVSIGNRVTVAYLLRARDTLIPLAAPAPPAFSLEAAFPGAREIMHNTASSAAGLQRQRDQLAALRISLAAELQRAEMLQKRRWDTVRIINNARMTAIAHMVKGPPGSSRLVLPPPSDDDDILPGADAHASADPAAMVRSIRATIAALIPLHDRAQIAIREYELIMPIVGALDKEIRRLGLGSGGWAAQRY